MSISNGKVSKLDKKSLRQEKIKLMKAFAVEDQKSSADQYLTEALMHTSEYESAKRIGIVLSMPHEVDTYPIISKMISDNKKVYVPETNYKAKEMSFKHVDDLSNIGPDDKGINHVISDTEISNDLDLLIVPGLAFNDAGYRIGYGGGYFDKFLTHHQQSTISLIYDFQLDDFEIEAHDQPVQALIIATTK